MFARYLIFILFTFILAPHSLFCQIPDSDTVLSTLDRKHPRLMMKDKDLARIKKLQKTDAIVRRCVSDVLQRADNYCKQPPLEYEIIGPRLLHISRRCGHRIYALALAWRLTGNEKYAQKAEENLLAVCSFKDWNPSHFLDTAEMSNAVGIGYDWLYHYLSVESRKKIKEGLIEKGLKPGIATYDRNRPDSGGWINSTHNWNQVCNGGLLVGALAIAETDPEYAKKIIPYAVESLPKSLATYDPDGAWPEGPGYWSYGSRYTAYGLSALESSLGTVFGLTEMEGLSVCGLFPIYTTGPTGLYLNYSDSGSKSARGSMPTLFWFAQTFNMQFLADQECEMIERYGGSPQHLIWYVPRSKKKSYTPDLDRQFRGDVEVAVFRSAWNDPEALFVGVKGGYNWCDHSHLDLGNFEIDALGVRWARDLGSEDYNLVGYWDSFNNGNTDMDGNPKPGHRRGGKRWHYYRLNSFSHNVTLLNGKYQDELARAKFLKFKSEPSSAFVTIDLTPAYTPEATRATRGVAIVKDRQAVLVQDEFNIVGNWPFATNYITWGMTTDAYVTVKEDTALLRLEGKELTARILSPEGACFTLESAEQKPPQAPNTGVVRLLVRLDNQKGLTRIAILLSPHWPDGRLVDRVEVKTLDEW
ncbi:DUF4962 domain-containing protein [Candidatus Latescibacterota bacterium]